MIRVTKLPRDTPVWIVRNKAVVACSFVGEAADFWVSDSAGTVLRSDGRTMTVPDHEIYGTEADAVEALRLAISRERAELEERLKALYATPAVAPVAAPLPAGA